MKLRAEQLRSHLKEPLRPLYIVSGDDTLLNQEACDAIRSGARQQDFSEREVMHVDNQFDWQELAMSANSGSLFASRKLIELRFSSAKVNEAGVKTLRSYADNPNPDTVILISAPKLTAAVQKSKWFSAIEKIGVSIQVWPVDAQQLPKWISQRLQAHKLHAEPDAVRLIAQRVEGNLLAAAQEIEKLALLMPEGNISVEQVAASVANSGRYNVFGLTDHALAGRAGETLIALNGLRNEGNETTLILWALTREIRSLIEISHATQRGQPLEQLLQKRGIFEKRKPLMKQALRRLSLPQLLNLLRLAQNIDQAIKGIDPGNPWDKLSDLVLGIAGSGPTGQI